MKQHGFVAWGSTFQFVAPLANQFPHVGLRSPEFLYLFTQRMQLLLGQSEHVMARSATIVAGAQNLRKLTEREAELKRSLRELNAIDCGRREYAVSPTCPRRKRQNADPFVVAERIGADTRKAGKLS